MWEGEIVPKLEAAPGVRAVAIFEGISRDSTSQFTDIKFRPQPAEVICRNRIVAARLPGCVVLDRLDPIDDGPPLRRSCCGTRRQVTQHGDWLVEQITIVPVQIDDE
jgi:hypothetical protein